MATQSIEVEFDDGVPMEPIELMSPEEAEAEKEVEAKVKPAPEKDDDDIELEIVDDTPEEDRGRQKSEPPEELTEEELEKYSEKAKKRFQHLTKVWHDERREKEAALRERQELEALAQRVVEENRRLKNEGGKSRDMLLEQAKHRVAGDLTAAERDFEEAYEAGEPKKLLEAQKKLNIAQARAMQLENVKRSPLQDNESEVQSGQVTRQPQAQQQPQVDPRAQSWAKENSWYGTDDEMTSFALGVHSKLVRAGVDPTSDDYYDQLNGRMRTVFSDYFGETEGEDSGKEAMDANVVAPVTRATSPKKLRLNQSQVRIAKKLGIPLEEYAKEVAILNKGN